MSLSSLVCSCNQIWLCVGLCPRKDIEIKWWDLKKDLTLTNAEVFCYKDKGNLENPWAGSAIHTRAHAANDCHLSYKARTVYTVEVWARQFRILLLPWRKIRWPRRWIHQQIFGEDLYHFNIKAFLCAKLRREEKSTTQKAARNSIFLLSSHAI